ncbi:conserved hypothetical protein [Microbacterium sp. C448]|uniref:DUF4011 domain-containing protein n=1 Tax=Microbacterium sp. C448 TaxID=1177594 RepID=UPI0003DE5094|nr:DUF4011 domain-containing protein [Microbacterium sp. C448]CDK00265.1 conserved hypothetical protein [Microbacterium sp. C448]
MIDPNGSAPRLNTGLALRVFEFGATRQGRVDLVSDESRGLLALEEPQSTFAFAEVDDDELRILPFLGDAERARTQPYVRSVVPSWLEGFNEIVIDGTVAFDPAAVGEIERYLDEALDYWRGTVQSEPPSVEPPGYQPAVIDPTVGPNFSDEHEQPTGGAEPAPPQPMIVAHLRADVSPQWSWASANARIPQISDIVVELAEPVERARITVMLRDADIVFGTKTVHDGPLPAGVSRIKEVHVPLSARVMSQVDDRRGAMCETVLEIDSHLVARADEAVDVQPRDLWNMIGDPLRSAQGRVRGDDLARSLLASFVRPNHPAVKELAREAADVRGKQFGEASFHAFQMADDQSPEAVEASITSIYEAIRARKIAYSEPPPGWDYHGVGQRIRDHGDVAGGGLATCLDTTVLTAAVIEDVGLLPVLLLIPGHIFIGYWRNDPGKSGTAEASDTTDWYPRRAVISDVARIANLVAAGRLGLIETTALTVDNNHDAGRARAEAKKNRFAGAVANGDVTLIDVAGARRLGVSPLPAVTERPDGVTEIFEYRVDAPAAVTVVDPGAPEAVVRERRVDTHPVRYRTWKSSLFSLNATNALLNLGSNARVQPLVLPSRSLGELEDMLNQDKSLSVHSAFDLPEVWTARGPVNARQLLESGDPADEASLEAAMRDRVLYVQRFGRAKDELRPISGAVAVRELRSMAHNAKTAREERGMNPLYLCLGILRWTHSPGKMADAPLILVPVNLVGVRGGKEFTLSLDATQQTTTNAALIEWLRREHGVTIPGLVEPISDRAGIDVNAVIAEVRNALVGHQGTLNAQVLAEARLATLDLSAFRMWQDLNAHADGFLERPLVRHLVDTPTEEFQDAAAASAELTADEIETLETPIPADSTQKRAVMWAKQGRTFVLQGPPGTGKSQTITNIVAECVLEGMRVLFVAEKGTALAVVQRRLESIGLSPFTLNLHHEGSNSVEVRASLQRALTASVTPDAIAIESARRRLRNARFELTQYPTSLHSRNAAGHSAYSAHDELIVLGEGPVISVPVESVAHHAESLAAVRDTFQDLQRWTSAAGVRPDHPWRLAGVGAGDPIDVDLVRAAIAGVHEGLRWADEAPSELKAALGEIMHPRQLDALARAANPVLPRGMELGQLLNPQWVQGAPGTVTACEEAAGGWRQRLRGFPQSVIDLDLPAIAAAFGDATESGFLGRRGRQEAALKPLSAIVPPGLDVTAASAPALLNDLKAAREAAAQICASIASVPGLTGVVPANPFAPEAFAPAHGRVAELAAATSDLRGSDEWTRRVTALAEAGHLDGQLDRIAAFTQAWNTLLRELVVQDDDYAVWLAGRSLIQAAQHHADEWKRDADYQRLLGLQQWCALVRRLECMHDARLGDARTQLLGGAITPDVAEDALARGVAQASLSERIRAAGLDRFDAIAHDQRVDAYAEAQSEMRTQWVTDAPSRLLERRGGSGRGARTGGLARELEKTTRRLGTRAILRKFGDAVQELTPLVLASPASVVDLIDPDLMEFDLVIFDEASQITVPEAIGALGRARAAVIVGDSKQMPPTRRVGGGANDEEIDDAQADEILEDQESILSECELARVPTLSLNWHYRSQDEHLIAFSNRKYYKGDLSSFPTPTLLSSETGIEFRRVAMPDADAHGSARGYSQKPDGYADGRYLRAGSAGIDLGNDIRAGANTNPAEAIAIVKAVAELIAAAGDDPPSMGIVTFNEPQRELIEDLLVASGDRGIAAAMDENKTGRSDVLFVKALEQVQGDERDIIVFSVAFSKQSNGKIPTNFGPLSNSGGERRLNVAITRARRKDIVFCSFDPKELDVSGSAYDGPKHFKEFLLDAARGSAVGVDTPGRVAIRDRHRDDIADALRAAGLHVMTDVGMSNFRLDLVLARADAPTRPILPVLLDGESWTRRTTVSDRDVLPLEVLEGLMGWPAVARIWWPMWMQNRDLVVSQVLEQVAAAEQAFAAPIPVPQGDEVPASTDDAPAVVADDAPAVVAEAVRDAPAARILADHPTSAPAPDVAFAPFAPTESELDSRPVAPAASEPPAREGTFVPAHTSVEGSRDTLDELPRRSAVAKVREQIADVVQAEGPVELGRLTRIVARRFGLNAVRTARAEEIAKLVPRDRVKKDRLGAFAWPEGLDPQVWTGYRPADKDGSRSLEEVAPEEIANAMKAVRRLASGLDEEAILRRTAEIFGIVRLGALVKARLASVYRLLLDQAQAEQPHQESVSAKAGEPAGVRSAGPDVASAPVAKLTPEPVPAVITPDAAVLKLAAAVEAYRPDLARLDEHSYYDYMAGEILAPDLIQLVNRIVLDPDYDGSAGHTGIRERASGLSLDDAHAVGNVASAVWRSTTGRAMEQTAKKIAVHLAELPDFDALPWGGAIETFAAAHMHGIRPGLVSLTQQHLVQYADERGMIAHVESEIKVDARRALEAMSPLERDELGFASRNAKKLQLALPYVGGVKETRWPFVVYWMARFESDESGGTREARYATASRALAARGATRAAISRTLGISTSILDRIERENRRNVVLAPDDPIVTDLATELA